MCHIRLPEPVLVKQIETIYRQSKGEYVVTHVRMVEPSRDWPEHVLGAAIDARPVGTASP